MKPACNTCRVAGKLDECVYDEDVKEDLASAYERRNHELEHELATVKRELKQERQQQQQLQLQHFQQNHVMQFGDWSDVPIYLGKRAYFVLGAAFSQSVITQTKAS